MNGIMKKLSCLVLVVCCFAVATASDVTYSNKIKNVYSIEEITAEAPKKAAVNNETTATGPVDNCLDDPIIAAIMTGKNDAYRPY